MHARIQRWLEAGSTDPLENNKATTLAFNAGPSSARQRNAIMMAFHRRADDGPLLVVLYPLYPHQLKKLLELDPSVSAYVMKQQIQRIHKMW